MSDLQCPATLLLACTDPTTTDQAADAVAALAARLAIRRVAHVWCGSTPGARHSGALAADLLGTGLSVRAELDALGDHELDGPNEDGPYEHGRPARVREVIEEIADLHRGETVLVLGSTGLFSEPPAPGSLVELRVDADGWVAHPIP